LTGEIFNKKLKALTDPVLNALLKKNCGLDYYKNYPNYLKYSGDPKIAISSSSSEHSPKNKTIKQIQAAIHFLNLLISANCMFEYEN
jgi:hypothetical protein